MISVKCLIKEEYGFIPVYFVIQLMEIKKGLSCSYVFGIVCFLKVFSENE